uniref:Uncharacterized protein n=1 Tax=Aegilops tauschii subsp. strangulata TaxID=200361 RepID=A0A453R3I6_AEGTS
GSGSALAQKTQTSPPLLSSSSSSSSRFPPTPAAAGVLVSPKQPPASSSPPAPPAISTPLAPPASPPSSPFLTRRQTHPSSRSGRGNHAPAEEDYSSHRHRTLLLPLPS